MTSGYDKNSVAVSNLVSSSSKERGELARQRKAKTETVVKPPRPAIQSERVFGVLSNISSTGAMRIKDISNSLRLPRQSTNALLQYLKRKDLVRKTEESLGAPFAITSSGRVLLAELEQHRAA